MDLKGLKIKDIEDLGNNDLQITLENGTTIVGHMFVVDGKAPAEAASDDDEKKPEVKEKKKKMDWPQLLDMDEEEPHAPGGYPT